MKRATETSAGAAGVRDTKRLEIQEDPLKEEKDKLKRQIEQLTYEANAATGVDRYFKLSREKFARWELAKLEYPNDLVQLQAARKALVDAEVRHEREVEEDKWAKTITGLEEKVENTTGVLKETQTKRLLATLEEFDGWKSSWPTREIELRKKFEETYAMPSVVDSRF